MSLKSKGIGAERELIHLLWKQNFAAIRVAGSGSSRYPSCDILASNGNRKFAFECKSIKGDARYIPHEDIEQFCLFCAKFGAEPWIAARFSSTAWHFLMPEDLKKTATSYALTRSAITTKGILLEELLQFS